MEETILSKLEIAISEMDLIFLHFGSSVPQTVTPGSVGGEVRDELSKQAASLASLLVSVERVNVERQVVSAGNPTTASGWAPEQRMALGSRLSAFCPVNPLTRRRKRLMEIRD